MNHRRAEYEAREKEAKEVNDVGELEAPSSQIFEQRMSVRKEYGPSWKTNWLNRFTTRHEISISDEVLSN